MNKPTDYPVHADQTDANAEPAITDITYAVLRDRIDAKQPVTDEMIRIAQTKLETAHINADDSEQSKFKLSRIRDRFRAN